MLKTSRKYNPGFLYQVRQLWREVGVVETVQAPLLIISCSACGGAITPGSDVKYHHWKDKYRHLYCESRQYARL